MANKNGGFFGAFASAFEAFLKVLDDGLEKAGVPYRCGLCGWAWLLGSPRAQGLAEAWSAAAAVAACVPAEAPALLCPASTALLLPPSMSFLPPPAATALPSSC